MFSITIRGTNYMLMHKYTVATVASPQKRGAIADYSQEWVKTTYLNEDGHVILPWQNLMASLFEGAKGERLGKLYLSRMITSGLEIVSLENLILVDETPVTVERIIENDWLYQSGAVISGRRVDRTRTQLPKGWITTFDVVSKSQVFDKQMIEYLVTKAGTNSGVGDWRPSSPKKPGPYGTYELLEIVER